MRWPHVRQIGEQIVVVAAMRPLNQQRPLGNNWTLVLAIPWYRFGWLATVMFLPIQMNVIECLLILSAGLSSGGAAK